MTLMPVRQLWHPVSAITETEQDIIGVDRLKPKAVQSSGTILMVTSMNGWGDDRFLSHVLVRLSYMWWSRGRLIHDEAFP